MRNRFTNLKMCKVEESVNYMHRLIGESTPSFQILAVEV